MKPKYHRKREQQEHVAPVDGHGQAALLMQFEYRLTSCSTLGLMCGPVQFVKHVSDKNVLRVSREIEAFRACDR